MNRELSVQRRRLEQPQNVSGPEVCATNNGKFSIAIGEAITGVIVGLGLFAVASA